MKQSMTPDHYLSQKKRVYTVCKHTVMLQCRVVLNVLMGSVSVWCVVIDIDLE